MVVLCMGSQRGKVIEYNRDKQLCSGAKLLGRNVGTFTRNLGEAQEQMPIRVLEIPHVTGTELAPNRWEWRS
jgi:hypothetical protein